MKPLSVKLSNCVGQLTQIFQDDIFAQYFDKPFEGGSFPIRVTSKSGTYRDFYLALHPYRNEARLCERLTFGLYLGQSIDAGSSIFNGCMVVEPNMSLARAILCAVHISGDYIKFAFSGLVEGN